MRAALGLLPSVLVTASLLLTLVFLSLMTARVVGALEAAIPPAVMKTFEKEYGIRFDTDTYSLDWKKGLLTAQGVKLQDEEGQALVSASRLRLLFDSPFYRRAFFRLEATGVDLHVVRLPDGSFALQRLLARRPPKEEGPPWFILIKDSTVRYVDQGNRSPRALTFRGVAASIQLQGKEGNVFASGISEETGELLVDAYWQPKGGRLAVRGARADLRSCLDAIRTQVRAEEVRRLRVREGRARVEACFRWGDGPVSWIAFAEPKAANVGLDDRDFGSFEGSIISDGKRWVVKGEAELQGSRASGVALVSNGVSGPRLSAWIDAEGREASGIWPLLRFETEVKPKGQFRLRGFVSGPLDSPTVMGKFSIAKAEAADRELDNVRGTLLLFSDRSVQLRQCVAEWQGATILADARYDFRSREVELGARVAGLLLESLAEVRERGLSGVAYAEAAITGSVDSPRVVANLSSPALLLEVKGEHASWTDVLGHADARVVCCDGSVTLPLIRVDGPFGLIQASGILESGSRSIEGNFDAVGVPLKLLPTDEELSGYAFVSGRMTGTLESPSIEARAEVFEPRYRDFDATLAVGSLSVSKDTIDLEEVELRRGAATCRAWGRLSIVTPSPSLSVQLSLNQLELNRLAENIIPEVPVSGFLSGELRISGTMQEPLLEGSARATDTVIDSVRIEDASAKIHYRDGVLVVSDGSARIGEGVANMFGSFGRETALAEFRLEGADLSFLNDYLPPELSTTGIVNLNGSVVRSGDVWNALFEARSKDTRIANLSFHSGQLHARLDQGVWSGDLELVQEEHSIRASLRTLDPSLKRVEAFVDGRLPLDEVRSLVRKFLPDVEDDTWRVASRIHGDTRFALGLTGDPSRPTIPFDLLLEPLVLGKDPAGSLSVHGVLEDDLYKFHAIKWNLEGGALNASGTYVPGTEVRGSVDLSGLRIEKLAAVFPILTQVQGELDLTAEFSGNVRYPEVDLSLALNQFGTEDVRLDSALFSLVQVREGKIRTDGAVLQKEGYVARLSGVLPFHYSPLGVPVDEPVYGVLSIPAQDLSGLRVFFPNLDAERTEGKVTGSALDSEEHPIRIVVEGTLENPVVSGAAFLRNGRLAVRGLTETIEGLDADLRLVGNEVRLEALKGSTKSGGVFRGHGVASLVDGLDGPLEGRVELDTLRFSEKGRGPGDTLRATLDGNVSVAGTLRRPRIQGLLEVSAAELPIPSGWESRTQVPPFPIEADLDVNLQFAPDTVLRTSRMEARVQGSARIERTISTPKASASLTALGGRIRLPATRLNIRPGSRFTVFYDAAPSGEAVAAVNVDMHATTHLVTASPIGIPNEYTIDLFIRGSLLEEGGLSMSASSSPPDLTESRILALLGHQGFLDTFAGGDFGSTLRHELMDVFGATVLPAFFDVLGPEIAAEMGLEAFTLTYSRFEPLTLNVSKSLFDGLTASYRRSLQGGEQQYQVKLMWRLPVREQFRGTFGLGWSYDEQRVHRLSLEWGTRF